MKVAKAFIGLTGIYIAPTSNGVLWVSLKPMFRFEHCVLKYAINGLEGNESCKVHLRNCIFFIASFGKE